MKNVHLKKETHESKRIVINLKQESPLLPQRRKIYSSKGNYFKRPLFLSYFKPHKMKIDESSEN